MSASMHRVSVASLIIAALSTIPAVSCKPQSRPIINSANQIVGTQGFVIKAPDGFEERTAEKMLYHPGYRASIRPAFEPGANFDQKAAEFTETNLTQQGMTLEEKRIDDINGRKTMYVKGRRTQAPFPQICVVTLFPAQNGCAQLIAIYPADTAAEIAKSIDSAVTQATYGEVNKSSK